MKYIKLVSIIILTLSFFLLILSIVPLETHNFQTSARVNLGKMEFDLNGTALTFGGIAKPGTSTRNIILRNDYNFPVIARISAEGDIKNILYFEKIIRIYRNETKKITFTATAATETSEGNYSGIIKIKILPSNIFYK